MADLSKEELLMLEDYQGCMGYLYHDERRTADFFKIFSVAETGLVVLFTWAWNNAEAIALVVSIFAIILSIYWSLVMDRMRAVIGVRYVQLRHIEAKLKPLSTFSIEAELKSTGKATIGTDTYTMSFRHKLSASKAESHVPLLAACLWFAFLIATLFSLVG
jgi:hypothetical protein